MSARDAVVWNIAILAIWINAGILAAAVAFALSVAVAALVLGERAPDGCGAKHN